MIKQLIAPGLAISTLLLSAGNALAGSFYVDTFSDPVGDLTQDVVLGTVFPDPGVSTKTGLRTRETVGGSRTLVGDLLSNTNNLRRAAQMQVITQMPMMPDSGYLNVENNAGVTSLTRLIWDGNGMGLGTDGQLLRRLDASGRITLGFLEVRQDTLFTLTLMDTSGEMATVANRSGFTTSEVGFFELEEFVAANMDINLDSIKSIELSFTGVAGADTQIDFVQGLELPEPSMVVGSLCALGLGFFSRKRSSKSDVENN